MPRAVGELVREASQVLGPEPDEARGTDGADAPHGTDGAPGAPVVDEGDGVPHT